jgi:hypothetical protein
LGEENSRRNIIKMEDDAFASDFVGEDLHNTREDDML